MTKLLWKLLQWNSVEHSYLSIASALVRKPEKLISTSYRASDFEMYGNRVLYCHATTFDVTQTNLLLDGFGAVVFLLCFLFIINSVHM